ncbi:MAG TPA: class I SAM-dependent methyltransferase [Gammaproteobacteria bacterium]
MDQAFERVLGIYKKRMEDEAARAAALSRDEFARHRDDFLLAVGEPAARFLHSLAIGLGATRIVELGTSYGFSTLFLADAARATGGKLYTYDSVASKQAYARERIAEAGLANVVEWRLGDALELLRDQPGPVDLVLIDIWKELYAPCFELVYPLLADGGVIVADNMIHPESAREATARYAAAVRSKPDMEAVLLSVGHGLDIACRRTGPPSLKR